MDLSGLLSIKVTWILVLEVGFLAPMINSQIQDCSIEGIDLSQCLNPGSSFSIDKCCKSLTQAVQAGYSCLCSLVAPSITLVNTPVSIPLVNTAVSLPFSNCFISVPPLTLCRVLAPMPEVLPPAIPKELSKPSAPPKNVLLPPPSDEKPLPLNSTTEATQPHSIGKSAPNSIVHESSNGIDETKILMLKCLLLCLALHACILLA